MSAPDQSRKLAAILAADVVGYSRLMAADEAATVRALNAARDVFRDRITHHGGRLIDTAGDSVLAEFRSVVEAVRCAVAIQDKISAQNTDVADERKMRFRIGVNLGDIIEQDDGTIYGDGVNVAARLEALADPGGVMLSDDAFRQVDGKVDLAFADAGSHVVKNIAKPVRAYRVVLAGTAAPKAKRKVVPLVAVLVLLIAVAGVGWYWTQNRPTVEADTASVDRMAFPLPQEPSIAVLPFDNLSGDAAQDFIADGLSENIISALSQARGMLVIARNSTFTYKGKPVKVQRVAEDLGVQYVLEGSVQVSGDQIRVTAQLIDALTGRHMLSERYDRALDDVFAVQDEITLNVVSALQVELTEGTQAVAWRGGTDNVEAWALFQQALILSRRYTKEDNTLSRELLQKAVGLDPSFALAWVYLAWSHWSDARFGWTADYDDAVDRMASAATQAFEIDPNLPDVYLILARVATMKHHDLGEALGLARKAVELNPNHSIAIAEYGVQLRYSGYPGQAIPQFQKAMRLSPHYPAWYANSLAISYIDNGNFDAAIPLGKEFIDRTPGVNTWGHETLLMAYAGLERLSDAQAVLNQALERNPDFSIQELQKHFDREPFDRAIWERRVALFRKAGVPEHPPGTDNAGRHDLAPVNQGPALASMDMLQNSSMRP